MIESTVEEAAGNCSLALTNCICWPRQHDSPVPPELDHRIPGALSYVQVRVSTADSNSLEAY
jgi:hypothetical protein